MSNETTLDDVLALVAKATPGEFTLMAGTNVMAGDSYSATGLQSNLRGSDPARNENNAGALVAALNYLRAHGDELRAALEDASKDSERLDFIELHGMYVALDCRKFKRDQISPCRDGIDKAIDAMAAGEGAK